MDFIDEVRALSKRCERLTDRLTTEEATKQALILPFIQLLGYNVFDPTEVVPEFTADVGTKKGEKVDYAIMVNGEPAILVEAKAYGGDLGAYDTQLFRYFSATKAKFAVLTDGVTYQFYSDLQEPNRMDSQPFLEFCMLDPKDALVPELKRFHKESFNVEELFSAAANLRYASAIRQRLDGLLKEPSDEFLRLLVRDIYSGKLVEKARSQLRPIVKRAITQYVNDIISERLSSAIQAAEAEDQVATASQAASAPKEGSTGITTTDSELEAFQIVRAILRREFSPDRITYKDTKAWFSILLDGNAWRWICRLHLEGNRWHITLRTGDGKERRPLNSLDDLFSLEDDLLEAARGQNRTRVTRAEDQ